MLFVALAVSTFFAFCVCQGVRSGSRKEYARSGAIAGMGFIAALMCMQSGVLLINTLFVAIAAHLCWIFAPKVRTFRLSVIGATVATYLIVSVTIVIPELREARQRKGHHPLESMADRLAYEKRSPLRESLAGPALERLARLERQIGDNESSKVAELRDIHESYVTDFVNSPGFGVVRMLGKNANSAFGTVGDFIWLEGAGIPLPADYEDPSLLEQFRDLAQAGTTTYNELPARDTFFDMHQNGLVDFVNRDGFGYIQDRKHVAGFRPHRFGITPSLVPYTEINYRWELRRLDLISMLKHEEPVAYISDHLPQMKQLRAAPVRSLDEIEKKMLRAIQGGEDLQVAWAGDRIRMVGSIRAARQCVKCHDVNRGDLLGAFSYKFQRR
jgi:hypothetical protein